MDMDKPLPSNLLKPELVFENLHNKLIAGVKKSNIKNFDVKKILDISNLKFSLMKMVKKFM